ncbi:class I SAM-dependent methyltransferase [Candidatus Micrarchaeota archaeon]|nr:class I SAM-dependent methyltransferase [Candidatus Micrarchaeota archaeon]
MPVSSPEQERVERLGESINYTAGFNEKNSEFISREAAHFYGGDSCLVLGPSESGEFEKTLSSHFKRVVCVDGSSRIINELRRKLPAYEYNISLFEDIQIEEKFDVILLMHVLEHVRDPQQILSLCKKWLAKEGVVIVATPNAYSINRLLGVKMGLLSEAHELHENDLRIGHRRVYDFDSLERDIKAAGFTVVEKQGVLFKPFPNSQMELLSNGQIEGLYLLGKDFPNYCNSLFFVIKPNEL